MAAEEPGEDVQGFLHEEHDVTCCLEKLYYCGGSTLILGEEDAEFISHFCCKMCNVKRRAPYGELGTVKTTECLSFYGFSVESLVIFQQDVQCTGCGCEKEKVDAIMAELKKRQALRGDQAETPVAAEMERWEKEENTYVCVCLRLSFVSPSRDTF